MIFKFQEFINEESSRAPLYHAIKFDRGRRALYNNKLDCYSTLGYNSSFKYKTYLSIDVSIFL